MINIVFYRKNALHTSYTTATMTPILGLTSIYYISQQDNIMPCIICGQNIGQFVVLMFVIYMLHAAVLLFAQLHYMVKLKY